MIENIFRNAGDKGKQFSLAKISAFGKSGGFDNYLMGGIDAAGIYSMLE